MENIIETSDFNEMCNKCKEYHKIQNKGPVVIDYLIVCPHANCEKDIPSRSKKIDYNSDEEIRNMLKITMVNPTKTKDIKGEDISEEDILRAFITGIRNYETTGNVLSDVNE